MPLRLRLLPSPFPDATGGDLRGPTEERALELPDDANEIRIGRRPDLELPLPYRALSALHARLVRIDDRWHVEDLGSTNGTRVDGERLAAHQPRAIAPGAHITLGQITFAFDGPAGAVVGAEGTATIARRLVSDLFASSPDMATPTVTIVTGVPTKAALRLEIIDRRYVMGRGETCDLQLGSDEISREHAEIVRLWDGVVVKDLGSKNGVRVNDALVTERCRLRDGDRLQIGPALLRLSDPADRYLRDFEARAPEKGEDGETEPPSTTQPANSAPEAPSVEPPRASAEAGAPPAQPGRRRSGSRTAIVVAAVALIVVGAVIVTLALGG